MTKVEEHKECPFCESKKLMWVFKNADEKKPSYFCCEDCGVSFKAYKTTPVVISDQPGVEDPTFYILLQEASVEQIVDEMERRGYVTHITFSGRDDRKGDK